MLPRMKIAIALAVLAQVQIVGGISIQLPVIKFEAPPPLVVVEPGIQVVQDYDDEVYFVDGWYWCRRDGNWFRTRDHHGGWVYIEQRGVPVNIVKVPPGKYKHYKVKKQTVLVPAGGGGRGVVVQEKVKVKHGGGHGKH
jgi:hypothetical protein